jgi:putative ABC transport system substrate-binding protein
LRLASALAAKSATATIPIVFVVGGDPVELGLVASLNRPGGNLTGVAILTQTLVGKRLELLHEIVPTAASIGFLVDPNNSGVEAEMREAEITARALGLRLVVLKASSPSEIETAFTGIEAQQIGALLTTGAALFSLQGAQLAALAARHAVPAIYHSGLTVEAGGLVSYEAISTNPPCVWPLSTRAASSRVRSLATCRYSKPQDSRWSSILRQPRRSASKCRRPLCCVPTR